MSVTSVALASMPEDISVGISRFASVLRKQPQRLGEVLMEIQ